MQSVDIVPQTVTRLRPGLVAHFSALIVGRALGLGHQKLITPSRGCVRAAFGRQLAQNLMVSEADYSRPEAVAVFGRHASTIGHALAVIETLRDVEEFDLFCEALALRLGEVMSAAMARPMGGALTLCRRSGPWPADWEHARQALVDALEIGSLPPEVVGTVVKLEAMR